MLLLALPVHAQEAPTVTITPEAGIAEEAVFDIVISGLQPESPYTVEILFEGEVVFSSDETSDADGRIDYPIISTAGDSPGVYTLQVVSEGEVIASADFELTAAEEDDAEGEGEPLGDVTVTPETVPFGKVQAIRIAELEGQKDYTLEISASETSEVVYRRVHRSDEDGLIEIEVFAEEGDSPGPHTIAIYDEAGGLVAEGEFTIAAPAERAAQVELEPASIQAGQSVQIALRGLAAFDSVTVQITSVDGVLIDTILARASIDGELSATFSAADGLNAGDYRVDIFVDAEKLASATLSVVEPEAEAPATEEASADEPEQVESADAVPQAIISIEPQAAPIGSSHLVIVSGLRASETVTLDVLFGGESVYRTEKTADATGSVSVELVTDAEDEPGDYIITVLRRAGNQPSVVLTAAAKQAVEFVTTTIGAADVIEGRLVDGAAEFSFDGEAGKYMLIAVSSADFDPAVALIDRDDLEIAFNDDSRGQKDSIIGPLALPYTGRYTLELSAQPLMMAQGAIDGDFVITIAEASPAPIASDAAAPFSLDADSPTQYYSLPVATGDSLTVTLDSGGRLDTVLQVVAPDGGEFAFDDDSGAGFDAELSNLVFDHAATYVLAVSSFDSGASGQGTMSIRRNPVHALEDGETVITLNDKAIRDLVVFDAQEDEYLVLNLDTLSGDVEDLYVTATVEGMEVMSYSTMGVPAELPLAFVMPMSGRVVVTLEKFGFDDGITLVVSLVRP
ncbi:MAG: hypothetical protein OXG78_17340 [Chloroflexi bacterium]|nr:hypothetical protein [Chloroflexota bacterium]